MKYLSLLACLLFTVLSFSQEEQIADKEDTVPFAVIENVPVYSGCDENMGNQALKQCMSSQIATFVNKNFNTKLVESLNLPAGKHRISVQFKVNKEGEIVGVRARAPHPELEKEAIRVVNLIPKMDRPGIQDGKPVIVPYGFPISFMVEDAKPLSKKEKRRLKKKNRS